METVNELIKKYVKAALTESARFVRASDVAKDLHTLNKASIWDEGYRSGFSNAMRQMSDEPNAPKTPNPYHEETKKAGDKA